MKRLLNSFTFTLVVLMLFGVLSLVAQDIGSVKSADPIKIYGNLGVGVWYYASLGIPNRMQPFSWFINGSPTLSIYGITLPFTFTFSEQERQFSQPFNQWGVSPYYKWITLHGGYRNLRFSEFTLNGHTLLGGGVELNPGKFRFGAVYGRLRQAVDGEIEDGFGNPFLFPPSYRRNGYSVKVGVGSMVNYVDLVLFQAQDDPNSVNVPVDSFAIRPESNTVIALKSAFRIARRINFDAEVAASAHSRNSISELQLGQGEWTNRILSFLNYNTQSSAGYAIQTGITQGFRRGSVRLQYRRIERQFTSFGQFFINTDLEQITVAPNFRLFNGKMNLSGSLGGMRDNLDKRKAVITYRTIGSANLMFQFSQKWNAGIQYGNYGTTQQKEQLIFNDSLLVSLVNQNIGVYGNIILKKNQRQKTININGFYNDFLDRNEFNLRFTRSQTYSSRIGFQDQWLNSGWSYSAGLSFNRFKNAFLSTSLIGPNLGFGYTPPKSKIMVRVNSTAQRNIGSSSSGFLITGNANATYQFSRRHGVQFNAVLTLNETGIENLNRFRETRVFLNYTYRFGS